MKGFHEILPSDIENAIKLIGDDWMLITAANGENVNTMTASWGSFGVLWNRPVCTCRYIQYSKHRTFLRIHLKDDLTARP